MRASRAVSLALLTVGLTVGGISAAAADASPSGSNHNVTSSAASSGSNSTTADGVTSHRADEGVAMGSHAYGDSSYPSVQGKDVKHDCTCRDNQMDRDRYGDHHRRHHDDDADQLTDLLEALF
ncbi:hypothetical protein [Actinospica robiniae]|uniref:hypothetical protein n=1 Tax=Actinospica robiniae TaxID=304901 RepID=UPI00040A474E|nr:hypothetical protein [Actinospica robiniae]